MVAVAVTAAKIATTVVPAGIEGGSALVNVANAATTGAKALETTTAAVEPVGGGVKAAEVGAKVVEAAPEATQAAARIDLALKNETAIPETAMNDLVSSPPAESVINVATPETTTTDAWAKEKFTEISRTVQPAMKKWDNENIPKSEDEIPDWIEKRTAEERTLVVNEAVNRDIEDWKSHHPEPDATDITEHSKWEKLLEARQTQSHQDNEAAYEQFLVQRQEENQGMSNQEFMRLYAVLLQKRAAADKFAMYLAKQPREQYVRLLPVLEDMRNKIGLLEAQLSFDAAGNKWKEWIIPAAVGVLMAAGAMTGPANEI